MGMKYYVLKINPNVLFAIDDEGKPLKLANDVVWLPSHISTGVLMTNNFKQLTEQEAKMLFPEAFKETT